jgi:acetyl-CoA carboxylase biotin carboxyl carrier protein
MPERTLIARVRPDGDAPATSILASPVVGLVDGAPRPGVFLNRFDPLLTAVIAGRRHVVRLPREVHGWVVEAYVPGGLTAVAWDQPLVRIDPRVGELDGNHVRAHDGAGSTADAERGDAIVVSAPSEGIFYRKASPDAPNFVETGATVTTGAVLGLVEVMKCFNPITYGGPGLPPRGEVVRILADDASEVRFAQELFWIRPVG